MTNTMGKTVSRKDAYEVWQTEDGSWTWYVRKKWQADDSKMYARWFCNVVTPICPNGESGDVYVEEIMEQAKKISTREQFKKSKCCDAEIKLVSWNKCSKCNKKIII